VFEGTKLMPFGSILVAGGTWAPPGDALWGQGSVF
jgi:hypothetical protein